MFIKLNDERIVNLDKVVEIKISEIDDTAVKYVFDTTEVMVEKYDSNANAKAGIAKVTDENFVDTEDEKKINKNYIKDVKVSAINPLKVEYVLFDGAPVKVTYTSEEEASSAVEEIVTALVGEE